MGESYALEIANAFQISKAQVARKLLKLEQADILIGQDKGRTRIYSLNRSWFLYASRDLDFISSYSHDVIAEAFTENRFQQNLKRS